MKNLKDYRFRSQGGIDYIVAGGKEGGEIAFEQQDGKGALCFGCDAKLSQEGLCVSYNVCYGVTKAAFFEAAAQQTLYERYFKVPKAFLRLIEELYREESQ